MFETINSYLLVILPVLLAGVGYLIKHFFFSEKKRREHS